MKSQPELELRTYHPSVPVFTCAVAVDTKKMREQLPVHSSALAICPSITARNKAIGRTELSAARRVRIPWKAWKLVQIALWQQNSLWNNLNYKQWKFIVKPVIVSEPRGASEQGVKGWSQMGEEGVSYQCVACVASQAAQKADVCWGKETPYLCSKYLFSYQRWSAWSWVLVGCKGQGDTLEIWKKGSRSIYFPP